jgi:1-acyl-sn-glycerol-3-phosphate acyltransferase
MEVAAGKRPTLLSRLVWAFLLMLYRIKRWTIAGASPTESKFIILGAPHTSNWDFVFFLGAIHQLGLKPSFLGKTSLFRWPLKRFMFDMGGIPIDRKARGQNYVDAVAAAFAAHERLALVIAPEGTRRMVEKWRSGFYHIAMAAKVPIFPAWFDIARNVGGIGPALWPSGDYRADMEKLAAFYRSHMPDHPKLAAITGGLDD